MTQNCILGAAIAVAMSQSITAFAGANDYVFEPVNTQVKKGDGGVGALEAQADRQGSHRRGDCSWIDMAPEGMAEMASPLTAVPSTEPGVYSFKTDLSMEGQWLLTIAAKVQGEPQTVVGKITFRAGR
jgi:YtkA-like